MKTGPVVATFFAVLLSSIFAAAQAVDHHGAFRTRVAVASPGAVMSNSVAGGLPEMHVTPLTTFGGTKYVVGSTITATSTKPEAEEHIAVDPLNSKTLFAAISDFSLRGGFNTTKISYSFDNGAHWANYFVPRNSSGLPATSDGASWQANSDPVVAIDRQGNVFVSSLYFNGNNNANGLYVAVSNVTAAGHTSGVFAVKKNLSTTTTVMEDKPWIAVDNFSTSPYVGRVYSAWAHFVFDSAGNFVTEYLMFSRSTTHGQSWSTPLRISPTAQDGAVQGAAVAVGPGGKIYVAYEVFFNNGQRRIYMTKSTNGGTSFSAPVAISPLFNEISIGSRYRTNSFPAIAINPVTGVEYVVYADEPSSTLSAEIEFIRSSAAGSMTFTAPRRINDVITGAQFFPAIAADSSGVIHVSFFDTRKNPTATMAHLYDVYATRSLDNGTTWAPNARVTAASADAGASTFIGDYAGVTAAGGFAHPVWTNGGFNGGQLKTATLH